MRVFETTLEGVKLIELDRFEDERGWFMELSNEERYRAAGIDTVFVQTNVSSSRHGVLRGLHYQSPHEQGKLVSVLTGVIFDVVVDIRRESPRFGQWHGCELSDTTGRQLWVPEGFAHGFLVMSELAIVHYSCTTSYVLDADRSLAWNDPDVAIDWPFQPLIVSEKDAAAPLLAAIPRHHLPASKILAAPRPHR